MDAESRARLDRAMSEDELLSAITEAATYTGWRWYHVRRSDLAIAQGHSGFPDLVLAKKGRILFLELKSQTGSTTPDQRAWLDALAGDDMRALSGAEGWVDVLVVRPSDLDDILRELGAKPARRLSENELIRAHGARPVDVDRQLQDR